MADSIIDLARRALERLTGTEEGTHQAAKQRHYPEVVGPQTARALEVLKSHPDYQKTPQGYVDVNADAPRTAPAKEPQVMTGDRTRHNPQAYRPAASNTATSPRGFWRAERPYTQADEDARRAAHTRPARPPMVQEARMPEDLESRYAEGFQKMQDRFGAMSPQGLRETLAPVADKAHDFKEQAGKWGDHVLHDTAYGQEVAQPLYHPDGLVEGTGRRLVERYKTGIADKLADKAFPPPKADIELDSDDDGNVTVMPEVTLEPDESKKKR